MSITLKAARVNKNLTQKQAGELIGVSPETIGSWETGKRSPNLDKIPAILKTYEVSFDDLIFLTKSSI